jgi:hypothetical protein
LEELGVTVAVFVALVLAGASAVFGAVLEVSVGEDSKLLGLDAGTRLFLGGALIFLPTLLFGSEGRLFAVLVSVGALVCAAALGWTRGTEGRSELAEGGSELGSARQPGPVPEGKRGVELLQSGLAQLHESLQVDSETPAPVGRLEASGELRGCQVSVTIARGEGENAGRARIQLHVHSRELPPVPVDAADLREWKLSALPPETQRLLLDTEVARLARKFAAEPGAKQLVFGTGVRLELWVGPDELVQHLWLRPARGTRPGDDSSLRIRNYLRALLEDLTRLEAAAYATLPHGARLPGVSVDARPGEEPSTCPYCKDAIPEGERRPCPYCQTVHHAECWAEAGGCTVLGCEASPRSRERT